jgi:outer membrane autotransporter protein
VADGKAGALGNAHCIDRGTRLHRALLGATSLAALGLSSAGASAQTANWTGTTSTDWFTGTNWSAGVPTFAATAYIDTTSPNATVIGAAEAQVDSIYVGNSGAGTLTIRNGGALSNTLGYIGSGNTSTGTVTVDGSGSTWTNYGGLYVGRSGAGTLTVRNGGTVRNTVGFVGSNSDSTGTVTVEGTGSTWANSSNLYVGNSGAGTLTIRNGGTVSNTGGVIGASAGSTGTVTVDGSSSTWTNSGGLYVGYSGAGTLTIQNGGTVSSLLGHISYTSGSSSTVTVDGPGSTWTNSLTLSVGSSGTGTLTVRNGGSVNNTDGFVGYHSDSTGTMTVDGSGSTWTNSGQLHVGYSGAGTLTIRNGGTVSSMDVYGLGFIGSNSGSTGTVTVDGSGSTLASRRLTVGDSGAGALTIQNGGSVSAQGVTIAANAGSTGTLNIGAGIGDPATAPGTLNAPTVAFGAGTGQIVFNHTATNYAFAPIISGSGAVTVEAGTTVLTGAGSSVGAVSVNGGTLAFGQTGTFTAASYATQSGAVTAIGGTAQLAVTGAFTQSAGSTLNVAIGANDPAITAATASLAGALNVSGYTGTQYTVIHTTGGITGNFASVTIGGSSSPADYLTATSGISGNDYIVHTVLTWNAGPAQGNGVFTLTNGTDAFNVGVALTNQTGPFASGWDGRSLTKNGAGTLTLSAMNTYTGGTTINGGTLAIAATGGITSDVTNNATFLNTGTVTGSVTNNAGAAFTQTGGSVSNGLINTGTVNANGGALNGAIANNAGGVFNVGGGVTGNGAFGNASGATLAVAGTGSYTLAGLLTNSGLVTVDAGGALTANGGITNNGALTIQNGGSVSASSVTIAANAGSTGTLNIGAGIGDPAAAPGTLNAPTVAFGAGAGQIVFNHTATNYAFAPAIWGSGAVTVEAGTTVLTGAGSSVGAVSVNGGTLAFGQTGTFTAASYTTQSGAATTIDGNAQLAVTGAFTQSAGSTLNVAIGANDPAITAATASLAGTLNVSGYAGTQYTVIHTTNGITGNFANVSIGGASSPVDYLTVMGGKSADSLAYTVGLALTWNAGPAQGNGVFTLTNGTDAFNVGVALTDQTGPFASGWDGKSLTKNGAGTLTLSAINTYTGATTINGGTLAIAATGGITSNVTNNATFENAGTVTGSVTNNAGATFTQTGGSVSGGVINAGTVNANGGALNGAIANNAGGVFNVGGGVTGNGAFGNASGATLAVSGTGSYTLAGLLTNSGLVTVDAGGALTANGGILNAATGVITNNGTVANDLDNVGLVTNNSTYNAAVVSNTGTITNNGTWNGNVVSSSGTIGNAGTWNGNIASAGTFANSGTVSNGLTNSGSATTSGGAINGAIVNSGVFTVTGTTTGNGTFSNSGIFALSGGDFTGLSSFTNSGLVTVASGGTLGAASFVNATGGIVDLRNGSATNVLNVAGNVTFNAGSIYKVDVNAAGQSDRIAATGTATLNGGTVQVTNAPGAYTLGARYTIVTSGSGVSGQFSSLTQSSPLSTPFLAFGLGYDPNNIYLDVTRSTVTFASAGQTRNQIATGGGLDSVPLSSPLVNAVAQLDMAAARNAFDQVSGEAHASAKTALIEDNRFVREAATNRIRAAFGAVGASHAPVMAYADPADGRTGAYAAFASLDPRTTAAIAVAPATDRFALWGQGFGGWGSTNSDGNAARLSHSTGGFLIGGDAPIFDTWRLGMMAGYSRTSFNVRDRASSGASDNYHLGLYGGTQWGNLGFRTGAAYTWHDISTSRSVAFPGFGDSLKGDYRAGTAQVFGELGYGIHAGRFGFEPFANLAYVNLQTDGFAERGGIAALRSASTGTGVTFTTLGLHASTDFDLGTTTATLRSTLGWRHAFGDTTPLATFALAGGSPFTVAGVPIAKDALVLDVGLDVAIARNTTLGVSYGGQYGGNAIDQSVRANFNVRF